jgi:hypothetical protein
VDRLQAILSERRDEEESFIERLAKTDHSQWSKMLEEEVLPHLKYAILSHRWLSNEPDLSTATNHLSEWLMHSDSNNSSLPIRPLEPAQQKLVMFCKIASKLGYRLAWADTCCIDKTNSTEYQESINSMFLWYRRAGICITYLMQTERFTGEPPMQEIPCYFLRIVEDSETTFGSFTVYDERGKPGRWGDEWFSRGWTLQELLAPRVLKFYTSSWDELLPGSVNDKHHLLLRRLLASTTGIPEGDLANFDPNGTILFRDKVRWASRRVTSRGEDIAYCLLGIFNIPMPIIYGEGAESAFFRFQMEYMKMWDDDSIFEWYGRPTVQNSLMASHPQCFLDHSTGSRAYTQIFRRDLSFTPWHFGIAISPSFAGAAVYYWWGINLLDISATWALNSFASFTMTLVSIYIPAPLYMPVIKLLSLLYDSMDNDSSLVLFSLIIPCICMPNKGYLATMATIALLYIFAPLWRDLVLLVTKQLVPITLINAGQDLFTLLFRTIPGSKGIPEQGFSLTNTGLRLNKTLWKVSTTWLRSEPHQNNGYNDPYEIYLLSIPYHGDIQIMVRKSQQVKNLPLFDGTNSLAVIFFDTTVILLKPELRSSTYYHWSWVQKAHIWRYNALYIVVAQLVHWLVSGLVDERPSSNAFSLATRWSNTLFSFLMEFIQLLFLGPAIMDHTHPLADMITNKLKEWLRAKAHKLDCLDLWLPSIDIWRRVETLNPIILHGYKGRFQDIFLPEIIYVQ